MSDQKQPDWDKITEGKIRHGVAVEAFSQGMELNKENAKKIEQWVQFIIHGYEGLNAILERAKKDSKPLSDNDLKEKVVDKFDGEVVEETDEDTSRKRSRTLSRLLGKKTRTKFFIN